MKIKIRVHSGKRVLAPARPTSHSLLFVTPCRVSAKASVTGRPHFDESVWTITHRPTGYAVAFQATLENALRLAGMLGRSAIPWNKLRSAKQAKQYSEEFRRVQNAFYAELVAEEPNGQTLLSLRRQNNTASREAGSDGDCAVHGLIPEGEPTR